MGLRRKLAVGAVAAVAVVAPVLTAVPASAATWDHTMHTDDGDPGGRVRFRAYGDVVELCDIEADGWAVQLGIRDMRTHFLVDVMSVGGNGHCVTHSAAKGHNLREGGQYSFEIGLHRGPSLNTYYMDKSIWTA